MPIRALLFDLDDTLLESHNAHHAAIQVACRRAAELHADWTEKQFAEKFFQVYGTLEERIENGELRFDTHLLFRTALWQETLNACGLAPELGVELAQLYLDERRRRYALYEEVEPLLERLAGRYPLVLVTNGIGSMQREKIEALRLDRWFPHLLISGEVGSWKPDPKIFQRALELAGCEPREALMVGDNLERDVKGAAALGIRTLWLRRYPHLVPLDGIRPDHEAADLNGFGEWVESLR
jgi:putative hydrolase of the HAD superfamily